MTHPLLKHLPQPRFVIHWVIHWVIRWVPRWVPRWALGLWIGTLCLAGTGLAQVSPFDGIKWSEDQPQVKVGETWYELVSIEGKSRAEILEYCQATYGGKANKRFVEDLVDVLEGMGAEVTSDVDLVLLDLETKKRVEMADVPMTRAKRQALYGQYPETRKQEAAISREGILTDIDTLAQLLQTTSSYARLHGDDALMALKVLRNELEDPARAGDVDLIQVRLQLVRAIGLLGDRHARLRFPTGWPDVAEGYLPFTLAPLDDGVVLVTPSSRFQGTFGPSVGTKPVVLEIEGRSFSEWVEILSLRHRHAPLEARRLRAAEELINVAGALEVAAGTKLDTATRKVQAKITQEDGSPLDLVLELTDRPRRWRAIDNRPIDDNASAGVIDSLFATLEGEIGYIQIPAMWSRSDQPRFFEQLPTRMEGFRGGKALIIDIRHNGGGTRDVLMALAPYLVAADTDPWIANVAHVRMTPPPPPGTDISGMAGRFLFPRGDGRLSAADRTAIDSFMETFKPEWDFDRKRFSEAYFLILRGDASGKSGVEPRHLGLPVYVLVNERCFSAASVFAAALKGLEGVTLAGVRTDGSSGRSQRFRLPRTGINLKLSTMISFQRDGKTLDGNGTLPDIEIRPDLDQVLGDNDTQLDVLLELIRK